MNETEYLQLTGHITEKLDNTAEYEDWLTIQDYVDELQSNLTKEQLAYVNLKKTFDKQYNENQQLKSQLKQRDEVINEVKNTINKMLTVGYSKGTTGYFSTGENSEFGCRAKIILDILDKYKNEENK